jgi:hypothetical protein
MPPSKQPPSVEPHEVPLLSEPPEDEEQQRYSSQPLYPPRPPPRRPLLNRYSWIVAGFLLLLFIGLLAIPKPPREGSGEGEDYDEDAPVPDSKGICLQTDVKELPDDEIARALAEALDSEDYLAQSVQRLSGAVQIPTESFDDMGPVGEDPRWDIFEQFHDYLQESYPRMYSPLRWRRSSKIFAIEG